MGRSSSKGSKRGKASSSPYNVFFTRELKRLKAENPEMSHKDAFKQAGLNWRTSLENPKNQSGAPVVPAAVANSPAPKIKNVTPATASTVAEAISADRAQAMLPKSAANAGSGSADVFSEAQNSGAAEKRPTPIGSSTLSAHTSSAPLQAPARAPVSAPAPALVPAPFQAPLPGSGLSTESAQSKTQNSHASQTSAEKISEDGKLRTERKDSAASAEGNVPAIPSMASHTVVTSTAASIAVAK
ncbi:hypothetical protein IWW45_006839 [Coemansia sp. RSA 485]|nr:hypothetical protein IWW45_006839 [Coemansia sp. RSA 485]